MTSTNNCITCTSTCSSNSFQESSRAPSFSLADVANQLEKKILLDTSHDLLVEAQNECKQKVDGSSVRFVVEKNEQLSKTFPESYPTAREEIEGGKLCSNYDSTNNTTGHNSAVCVEIKKECDHELESVAELCNKVGTALRSESKDNSCGAKRNLQKVDNNQELTSDIGIQTIADQDKESISSKEDIPQNVCYICGKVYKQFSHLSRHMKTTHLSQEIHQCSICQTTFNRSESLIRHLKMHESRNGTNMPDKEGPFKCPKCYKTFQQSYNVTRHLLSHTGEKPFQCSECNKSFTQYTGLSRHLVLHNGSKDFKCDICGISFARLFVLNRHLLTHTDDKPYKCFLCSKSFIRAGQLAGHMQTHQEKKYKKDKQFSLGSGTTNATGGPVKRK